MKTPLLLLAIALAAPPLGGCIAGPATIEWSRTGYNEAVRRTDDEQLLLNLVRLRYRDTPQFLELGSISSQFSLGKTLTGSADFDDILTFLGGSASLKLDATEKPTVSYTPLSGEKFVKRLLTPVDFDVLVLLSHSGWSMERILRLCVQQMNGLQNAPTASGPTPAAAPRYAEFTRAAKLMRSLQQAYAIQLAYTAEKQPVTPPLRLETADWMRAHQEGYGFEPEGGLTRLTRSRQVLRLQIGEDVKGAADVAELRELLGLTDGDQGLSFQTRSLMATIFYLSQAVEPPQSHVEDGLVTVTRRPDGSEFRWSEMLGDLFRVQNAYFRPRHAAVSVKYRGRWFYIDDADLQSKSTFGLLSQLFALQSGGAKPQAPVLTLSVD